MAEREKKKSITERLLQKAVDQQKRLSGAYKDYGALGYVGQASKEASGIRNELIDSAYTAITEPAAKGIRAAAPYVVGEKGTAALGLEKPGADIKSANARNLAAQKFGDTSGDRNQEEMLRAQDADFNPEKVGVARRDYGADGDLFTRATMPGEVDEFGKMIASDTALGATPEGAREDFRKYGEIMPPPDVAYNAAMGGKPGPIAGSPAGGELPSQMDVDQYIAERQAKRADQRQATQQRKLESPNYRALRPGQRRKLLRAYESDMDDIASKVASRRITPRAASQMLGAKKAYYSEAFGMGPKDLASEQGLNYRQAARETALMERGKQSDAAMMARDLVSRDTQLEAASMRNQPQAKWMKASRPIMEDGMKTGEEPIFVDPETERMFVPGEGGSEAEIPPVAGARKDRDGIWWVKNADGTSTRVK